MRTLITGGAGFVGSHLCERFLAEGHEVICVDNCITGATPNIDHVRMSDRFSFIRHDISHPLEIDGQLDNILHFASPASPSIICATRFPRSKSARSARTTPWAWRS